MGWYWLAAFDWPEGIEGVSVSLTARYLQEWLIRHVNGADRDLAAALRLAGMTDATDQRNAGGSIRPARPVLAL